MKTIEWHIETGMQGAEWNGEVEIEDDATDEEIEETVRQEVFNIVSWNWWRKDDGATAIPSTHREDAT